MNAKQIENELREYLGKAIEEDNRHAAFHQLVVEVLREHFNGKPLTKRIERYFREKLPEHWRERAIITLQTQFGLYNLMVWAVPGFDTYDKRVSFFMGHTSHGPVVSVDQFDSEDAAHGKAAIERNKKRQDFLQGEDIAEVCQLVEEINRRKELLAKLVAFEKPGSEAAYFPQIRSALAEPRD